MQFKEKKLKLKLFEFKKIFIFTISMRSSEHWLKIALLYPSSPCFPLFTLNLFFFSSWYQIWKWRGCSEGKLIQTGLLKHQQLFKKETNMSYDGHFDWLIDYFEDWNTLIMQTIIGDENNESWGVIHRPLTQIKHLFDNVLWLFPAVFRSLYTAANSTMRVLNRALNKCQSSLTIWLILWTDLSSNFSF